jgi:hypothetical protein
MVVELNGLWCDIIPIMIKKEVKNGRKLQPDC